MTVILIYVETFSSIPMIIITTCVISGFSHNTDEICALLGYYFLTLEDGTDALSQNIGKGLPLNAA
jgi:hypothetical protein